MPGGEVHLTDASLAVQRGQPVHSVYRTCGQTSLEAVSQLLRIQRVFNPQNFDTQGLEP